MTRITDEAGSRATRPPHRSAAGLAPHRVLVGSQLQSVDEAADTWLSKSFDAELLRSRRFAVIAGKPLSRGPRGRPLGRSSQGVDPGQRMPTSVSTPALTGFATLGAVTATLGACVSSAPAPSMGSPAPAPPSSTVSPTQPKPAEVVAPPTDAGTPTDDAQLPNETQRPDYLDEVLEGVIHLEQGMGGPGPGMLVLDYDEGRASRCPTLFPVPPGGSPTGVTARPSDRWPPICATDPSGGDWGSWVREWDGQLGEYLGRWQLLRRSANGQLARAPIESYRGYGFSTEIENSPPVAVAFYDFDGDGRVEAVFVHREAVNNATNEMRYRIWSAAPGALRLYAPSRSWVTFAIADVDQDDRPDLFINPYAASSREPTIPIDAYPRHSSLHWGLLAHGQPDGTFSLTSPIARRVAERICAGVPTDSLPEDPAQWPGFLHYRKLRGDSEEVLAGWVRGACATPRPATDLVCRSGKVFLERMAKTPLALQLQ